MNEVMDIAPLIYWAATLLTLANLANILWMWFSGPTRKLTQRLADTEGRLLEAERRMERHSAQLASLSQTVNAMPGHSALHQLELMMASMGGDLREMRAVMEGNAQVMARLEAVVTRHEDHLLQGGKR